MNFKNLFLTFLVLLTLGQKSAVLLAESPGRDTVKVKKGWSMVPLPLLSYSSDVGLSVGGTLQFYNHGDGKLYPNFYDELRIQSEYMTSKAGKGLIFYKSSDLIKSHIFTFNANFSYENRYDFRGYNGYNSPILFESPDHLYYQTVRRQGDLTAELSRKLIGHLDFMTGIDFFNVKFDDIEGNRSLYTDYVDHGIIEQGEKHGGNNIYLRTGLMYDSRDLLQVPSKGLFTYLLFAFSPDLFNGLGDHHLKVSLFHSQYVSLYKDRLIFAYRIAYQGVIAGNAPFYLQQAMTTSQQIRMEGLGGMKTVRGVMLNRVVGRAVAFGNFELRYNFASFDFLRWKIDLGVNPFLDLGMVVQRFRPEEMDAALALGTNDWICSDRELPHITYGLGAKVIVDKTYVLSAELGIPFDRKRDGKYGLSLRLDYMF